MTNEQADKLRKDILNDNKMLYCMYKRPMTETCMCWGLDIEDAWLNEVDDLSKKLEGMNALVYPLNRVRIQADQVKSKFGTLHYYYSVAVDPPAWMCMYERAVEWLMDKIKKVDFKYVTVIDKEPYDEIVEKKIPADKVESEKKAYVNCSNVEIIEKDDGTAVKKITYHHYRQTHQEPTKHKWLHKVLFMRYSIMSFLRNVFRWKPSYKQECIREVVEHFARTHVHEAEKNCMHICEECGKTIDREWSGPSCMTLGWISYLCEECADKSERVYLKNGEHWCAGKKVEEDYKKKIEEKKIEEKKSLLKKTES